MLPGLKQAWKAWGSARAVGAVVVLAFAIGIGSSAAIFTVVDGLLFRPLIYRHSQRFVSLLGASTLDPKSMSGLLIGDVLAYKREMRSFDVFGWMQFASFNLAAPGPPQFLHAVRVTPELANGTGVNPRIGRWFRDGSGAEAVLSYSLWQRLGGGTEILGKVLSLSGRAYAVAGVMPPGFHLPLPGVYTDTQADIWVPLDPEGRGEKTSTGSNFCYARLRPGVTAAQADAEARRIAVVLARQAPESHPAYTARVDGLQRMVTKDLRPILLLLFGAAEFLLLITCANVGGLLLARSVERARETAVRVALGAGLRQLGFACFCEGVLLAVPGALAGLALARALVNGAVAWSSRGTGQLDNVAVDGRVALFALGSAVMAGAIAGVAPLWQAIRTQPNDVLSEGVRASASRRSHWLSRAFVIAEIALAFVLLSAGALLAAELRDVTKTSPGFDVENLLTFRIAFAEEDVPGKATRPAYQERLIQAIQSIPGVSSAAVVNQLPLDGCCLSTVLYPEDKAARPGTGERVAFLAVSPGYWQTLRIPLRSGRLLGVHDNSEALLAAVINEAAVRRYWPNLNPIGAYGRFAVVKGSRFQVIGVVGDVKNDGLDNATVPEIYLSAEVSPPDPMNFAVRSVLPAGTLVPEVRRAIAAVNPHQPIHNVRTMREIAAESTRMKRVAASVMAFFAVTALLLATIGTYGMVSYAVRQRTVEMGVRMALGAVGGDLLRLVVGSGLKMAVVGIGIGGVVSTGAIALLVRETLVRHVGVLPFAAAALVVCVMVMAASLIPAWRATLLSPLVAIRNQPDSMWESARAGWHRLVGGFGADDPRPAGEAPPVPIPVDPSQESIATALEAVRRATRAGSAILLEGRGGEYHTVAAAPPGTDGGWSIPGRGLLLGRLRNYGDPLPIAAEDLDVWRRWAAEYRPGAAEEIATLTRAGVRMAVALHNAGEVAGVLLLGEREDGRAFTRADKQMLRAAVQQFVLPLNTGAELS